MSRQGSTLDEGLHRRARNLIGGIPASLQQSKGHPLCKEYGLPLQDQTHPTEISLDPGEGRR